MPRRNGRFALLLIASLVGLAASIWMTRAHFALTTGGFEEKSFCNINEFIDCDTALASRYSRIGSVPTSELGILYYSLAFLGLLVGVASKNWRQPTLTFLFASSVFAILYSGVMAYLSIIKIGVLCLLCLSTYLANLIFVLLLPGALGIGLRSAPAYLAQYVLAIFRVGGGQAMRPRLGAHLIFSILFFGVGLLFFKGLNPNAHRAHAAEAQVPPQAILQNFYSQPVQTIDVGDAAERPSWGRPDAKITIVEFSDFQCPFCRRAAFTLKPYLGEYRKEVRFVFINYPLDSACNPAITRAMHPVSCLTAKGALCAHREGRFWEFHDEAFENQKKLSRDTIVSIAKRIGLKEETFNACLVSSDVEQALKKDIEVGNQVQVHGTPTVFVNGRPLHDWMVPERLRLILEAELKK